MRIIYDIPHQLVIHAQSVLEIGGFEGRVAQFLAYLGFKGPNHIFQRPKTYIVSYHQEINAAILILDKDTGDDDKLHPANRVQPTDNIVVLEKCRVYKEVAKGR